MKIDIDTPMNDIINLERGTNRMVSSASIKMTYNLTSEGIKYIIGLDKKK